MVRDEGIAVQIFDHALPCRGVGLHQPVVIGVECSDDDIDEIAGKVLARDAEIEQADRLESVFSDGTR
jgi:hypothetical protein